MVHLRHRWIDRGISRLKPTTVRDIGADDVGSGDGGKTMSDSDGQRVVD